MFCKMLPFFARCFHFLPLYVLYTGVLEAIGNMATRISHSHVRDCKGGYQGGFVSLLNQAALSTHA